MKAKGFRQIDNQLFSALIAAKQLGSVAQIVLVIIDRTIGFREEKAAISLSRFQDRTGLSRQSVRLAIKQAEKGHIITTERDSTKVTIYALNTDFSQWLTSKPNHPSGDGELGKQITLAGKANHPSTRKSATPRGEPVKKGDKYTSKEKTASFEDYKQELRGRFSDLDFDIELEKFTHYWSEGTRKLQRPKLALLNWMMRARKFKAQESSPRAHRQSSRRLPKTYRSPEEIFGEQDSSALKGVIIEE